MNRKEAAELLPIIQAFSEGKEIQKLIKNYTVGSDRWIDVNSIDTSDKREYRIKPEPTYRPFANAEECWKEMQKHQPFGWIKLKGEDVRYYMITGVTGSITAGAPSGFLNENLSVYESAFNKYLFADGLPFGVKVEE